MSDAETATERDMSMNEDYHDSARFSDIAFSDFERLASDSSLSKYEKIGFPDSFREGFEEIIYKDIASKCTGISNSNKVVVDIGPGCSDLPVMIASECQKNRTDIYLIDSGEMLKHLPDGKYIHKVEAHFPNCPDLVRRLEGSVDSIICYSVFQYVIVEVPLLKFLDSCLAMLAPGGQLLIGDIPNVSKKKRFLASDSGVAFHRQYMNTEEKPQLVYNCIPHGEIDDSIVLAVLARARLAGFNAYIVPQPPSLPMSNRREDILIIRP